MSQGKQTTLFLYTRNTEEKEKKKVTEAFWFTGFHLIEFKLKNKTKNTSVTVCHGSIKSFVISEKKSNSTNLYIVVLAK